MKRRDFTKLAVFAPVLLLIKKFVPEDIKGRIYDDDVFKNIPKGVSALATRISFIDKDGKHLHYGRLISLDHNYPEVTKRWDSTEKLVDATMEVTAEAIKRTYRDRMHTRLKNDFNFF